MADEIRCPMCSKNNPAGVETCRHCGARISTFGDSAPVTPSDPADWLKDLRITPSNEPGQPAWQDAGGADDIPDWLADDRGISESASTASEGEASALPPADDLPDWIRDTAGQSALPAAPVGNAGMDDWHSSLRGPDTSSAPTEDLTPAEPAGSDDRLTNLQSWSAPESSAESGTPAPEADADSGEVSLADGEDNLAAWLQNLDGQDTPTAPAEPSGPPEGEVNWADQFNQPAAGQPAADESIPDWMSTSFGADQDSSSAAPVGAVSAAEELPDWLSGLGAESTPESSAPAGQVSFPAWFSSETVVPEETAPAPAAEVPDFAAMFADKAAEETQEEPRMENLQPQVQSQPPQEPVQVEKQPSTPAAFEPSVPDWLAAFAVADGAADETAPGEAVETPFIDPQQPDWLKVVDQTSKPSEQEGPPALFEEPPQPQPDLEINTPFQVDLPDWLDNPQLSEQEAEAYGEDEVENLATAELPAWVQEMRPLESVIPGQEIVNAADQQRIEKAGPLAGMRGVLPSEEPAAHFRKLPTYSAKLRVSERQHVHAGLLQNVLDVETQPTAIPVEASSAPQYIYRLLIAAVLIVTLVFGLVLKDFSLFAAPVPGSSDKGLLSLFNEIESVPAGAPVLVAVDYEAALSGEMRFAASSVLDHLMARGANLIIVSTVPAGPILANDLLVSVQQGVPAYELAVSTVNLGYLPGGATSLLEFAQRPSVAAPMDQNGSPAWENPVLQGIQTIQDFKMVLVLTDSVETGRAWVEQVQPVLGSVPLTMVSSAQAGPLLQPYLDAGQIKGLVNGLMGGAMYEQRYGKLNLANKDWNAYQLGYAAGIIMLILGSAFSALRRVAQKPKKARG